jgi:hypothetical protein
MKVKSIRYFETRRGLGYEAKTQFGTIWNDGNGGCTYFEHDGSEEGKALRNTPEDELEQAINIFEGVD